jgi:hypothetical protein
MARTIGRHAPGGVPLPFYLSSMIRKSGYRFSEKIHAQMNRLGMIEPKAGPTAG